MEQSGRAARKTAEQVADKLADSRKGRKQHQQIMDDVLANSPDLQTAMGELAPTQEQMKATRGTLDSHGNITFDTPGTTDVTAEVVTAFEKLDWELGTVKDAYSKTRRAQRSPAGTVEVWQEKRQKWAATKDQLVIKTFKPGSALADRLPGTQNHPPLTSKEHDDESHHRHQRPRRSDDPHGAPQEHHDREGRGSLQERQGLAHRPQPGQVQHAVPERRRARGGALK